MQPVSNDHLIKQLNWRYATKKFDRSRKIPADIWQTLEKALVLSPSSFGLQPWRFLVVTDQPTKEKLVSLSWNQQQPADCSHYVVFAARTSICADDIDRHLQRTVHLRGGSIDALAGYRKMMLGTLVPPRPGFEIRQWSSLQAYIALGNFMTSAAMLGIDTCPMEGIESPKYDELFNLPAENFAAIVACAAGYRAPDCKYATMPKVRFEVNEVIRRI